MTTYWTPNPSLNWPLPDYLPSSLNGMRVVARDELFTVMRIRPRPRHCNRRQIWRKWEATKVVREADPNLYQVGGMIVGHSETIKRMAAAIDALNSGHALPSESETTV